MLSWTGPCHQEVGCWEINFKRDRDCGDGCWGPWEECAGNEACKDLMHGHFRQVHETPEGRLGESAGLFYMKSNWHICFIVSIETVDLGFSFEKGRSKQIVKSYPRFLYGFWRWTWIFMWVLRRTQNFFLEQTKIQWGQPPHNHICGHACP